MREVSIFNLSKNVIISERAKIATEFISKFRGLMFKREIEKNGGLILVNTNSIHTFFMYFPIDVLFLNSDFLVIKKIENLKPNRITSPFNKAKFVVELKTGKIKKTNTEVGDKIIFDGGIEKDGRSRS